MNSRDIAVRIVFCCVMFIPFSSIAQLSNGAASVSGDMEYECYRYLAIGEDFKVQVEGPHLASFSLPDYDFVKLEFLNQLKHLSSRSKRISGQTWVEIIDVQDLDKVHRLESSVLFMNLDILADGSVAANCYDSVHGWQLVFGRIVASGLIADDYRSKISASVRVLAEKVHLLFDKPFSEKKCNEYFRYSDQTALEFYGAKDQQRNSLASVKNDDLDFYFQSLEQPSEVSSVFIVPLEGVNCSNGDSKGVAQLASLRLMPEFRILERSNLELVLEEQKMNLSGLTEANSVLELGKMQGAEGVVFCEVACVAESNITTVKLLDCNTGEQQWIAQGVNVDITAFFRQLLAEL